MPPSDRKRVDDSMVVPRFTSAMNAATSRFGVLCDIPTAFVMAGLLTVVMVAAQQFGAPIPWWLIGTVVALPLLASLSAHIAFRNGRTQVVAWVSSLPFPIDNVNAVLSGFGEYFEIHFVDAMPTRDEAMQLLEAASEDTFVLELDEARKVIDARFGVVDHKHNPIGTAHRRYQRMMRVMDHAVRAMHERWPVARVLIV